MSYAKTIIIRWLSILNHLSKANGMISLPLSKDVGNSGARCFMSLGMY